MPNALGMMREWIESNTRACIDRGVSNYLCVASGIVSAMTMMNVEAGTLATRMRTARLVAGLEQTDLATALGVSRNTVSNWENGHTEPSVSQFIAWAEITKQPADQLIDGLSGSCARRDSNSQPSVLELDREFWAIVGPLAHCQDTPDSEMTHSAHLS